MSRIDLHIVGTANFAQAESSIARLKAQIASINSMGILPPAASKNLQSTFANALNASGMFQARMTNLTSETEKFGRALERGNLRGMQYFRAGSEYLKKQQGQIRALAKEQVRMQQTRGYGFGDGRAVAVTPRDIDGAIHKQQILNEQHRIFRQVVQGGATQLINWGKNTQWAGRQLTVGLTVPLTIFGTVAGKMFMDMDKQLTRMVKVYGDASKGMVDPSELQKIRGEVTALSQEIASSMGIAATETAGVAADIAATGQQGAELLASTKEAMRLSVLGEVDRQEAMRATLALQSAFGKSTDGLTESINFLNAVENQTSTSLNDLVEGIVKAGPVVKGLGGDVEELALMMVAMREGGIPASEAANAIKSSLASLINPTKQTIEVLREFGIDIKDIVDRNAGDVIGTLGDLQTALSNLDDLSRQRSIEQIFGKFQFSRINALLSNLNKVGGQTQQVMELASMSTVQLAENADKELKALTESASGRFTRAVEGLKASLIPIGETFVELGTTLLNFAKGVIDAFNDLPTPMKNFVKFLGLATALAGPLIMMVGIFGNFFGYIVKTAGALLALRRGARGVFEFYTAESVAARNITELVSAGMYDQTKATQSLKAAIDSLSTSLATMASQMNNVGSASMNAAQAANVMAGSARNAAVASLSGAQRGKGSESKGYLLWHQTPKAAESTSGQTLLYGARAVPSSMGGVNSTLGAFPFPVLSGNKELDAAAIQRYRQAAARGGQASLSAAEVAASAPNYRIAARQSAGMVGRAQIEAALVQSGMPSAKAVSLLGTYSQTALTDPVKAINELQQAVGKAGVNIRTVVDSLTREFEETYLAAIKSGKTIEQATSAAYARMKTLEQQAIAQGASGAYIDPKTGKVAKRGAVTAGVMLSDDALRRANISAMTDQEQAQATGRQAVRRGMGDRQVDTRTTALQQQINAVEEQRIKSKRSLFVNDEKVRIKSEELSAIQAKLAELEKQKLRFTSNSSADRMATAVIDQQIRDLATKEKAARRSLGSQRGRSTTIINQLEEQTARKRALEAQRETSMRKALTAQIMQGANIERTARGSIAAALRTESSSILKRVVGLEQVTIAEKTYYSLLNKHGQTIALVDASTQRVIRGQEMVALKWSQLSGAVSKEIGSMTMSSFARKKLDLWMNSLSNEVRQQVVSHELVQQANGKYIIALKTAEGKILAQSQAFHSGRFGGRLGGGAMGAGMVAGMGTMFLPMGGEDNTGANVAGGALMGASMGAMLGSMVAPGIGTVVGLVGGAVAGSALPAIQAYQKNQQEANDALVKYAEALNGSSITLDQFASQLGKLKPSEKLTTQLGDLPLTPEDQAVGRQLLDTEAGQKLLETSRMFGGEQLRISLLNQLQQLTLMEIFTPEEAKSVAQMLAIELGDPTLGKALINGIGNVLDDEGNLISDKVAEAFMKTIPDISIPEFDPSKIEEPVFHLQNFYKETKYAQDNLPQLASQLDKLREAQALATQEFMSGQLTYEEYSSMLDEIQKKNILAADAIMQMKESGADVGAILKDIADMGGRGDDYTKIEEIGKSLYDSLGVGERFLTQLQLGAAYGDVTLGMVQELANLAADPEIAAKLSVVFDTAGGEDNALEIIKMIQMGVDPELLVNITTNAQQIGKPLADVYALISSLSGLPDTIKKSILTQIESDPAALQNIIDKYEYAASLPDSDKQLKVEIFGNEYLTEIQDNWKAFLALPDEERKTAVVTTLLGFEYSFAQPVIPTPTEVTDLTGPDTSAMLGALDSGSGGGGSGGSSTTDAIDKKIKQQDQIIKQIQKEREERQKLLDLEKKALDFAMRQQDLESQIMIAKAEGRNADAALLQSQLDANRISEREDEKERLRQEEEDRRIRKAEREKKRLEKQKSASSGGGSGGGGMSDEQRKDIERRLEFLNNQLTGALNGNIDILNQIEQKGADAFWDSEPIKNYIREAERLGIPLDVINQQLETTFDYLVTQGFKDYPLMTSLSKGLQEVGIYGSSLEKILPNIFAIMQDDTLTKSQVIDEIVTQFQDAGMSADEAREAAEKFFRMTPVAGTFKSIDKFNEKFEEVKDNFSPSEAKIISEEFAKGIRTGATKEEVWAAISRRIHKSVYEDSALNPLQADEKAAATSQALKNRVNTEFENFGVDFPVESTYNSGLPDWLEGTLNQGYQNKAMRALGFTVDHDVSGDVKYTPDPNSTQKVSGTVSVQNVGGNKLAVTLTGLASGGLVKRGTGGMIYGPGGPTEDRVPAMLSNGEYVIRASSVDKYGIDFLNDINVGRFATGGYISADRAETQANNGVYAGGWKKKPKYSGGTPTYSGGYNSSNRQASYIPGVTRPKNINAPSLSEEVSSIIMAIRGGLATAFDAIATGFIPPWMRNSDNTTTGVGEFIGGAGYNNSSASTRALLAMGLIPAGRGGYSRTSHMTDITGLTGIIGQGAKAVGGGAEGKGFYTAKFKKLVDMYQEGSAVTPWRGLGDFVISGGSKDAKIYKMSMDDRLALDAAGSGAFDELTESLKSQGYQAMEIPFTNGSTMVKYIADDVFSPSHVMYQGSYGLIRRKVPDLMGADPVEIIQALGIPLPKVKSSYQNRFGKHIKMPVWMEGLLSGMKDGGPVVGLGGPTSDSVPRKLSNGEYVIKASSVDKYGIELMDMINNGSIKLIGSGQYSKYPLLLDKMSNNGYGIQSQTSNKLTNGSNIEYNINVSVEGSNSSADEIASKVMSAIERKQNMSRTVNRI